LRPSDVQNFISSLNVSQGSKNSALAAIKALYRELVLNDILKSNPAINIKSKKASPVHHKALTDDQVKEGLLNVEKSSKQSNLVVRNKAIVYLLVHHALRRSEICSLKTSDFDGTQLLVHGKGGRQDHILLSDATITAINDWIKVRKFDSEFLFTNAWGGKKLTPESISKLIHKIFNCSPHQLRATSITCVYENSENIRIAQSQARHSSINTTLIYTKTARQKELHQHLPKWS
jgi:integrase/recombinase XerD